MSKSFDNTLSSIKSQSHGRLDAVEQVYFARQLEYMKSKSYDIKYPTKKARQILPVSFEVPNGAETIKYEQFDSVGAAKIINNYAKDFRRVDVKGKEYISNIKSIGDSYAWNIQEIRAAQLKGMNLQQSRANVARKAAIDLENTIALFGDAAYGLGGFLTNANITTGTVTADGVGATTTWSTKSPDQILRDMNDAVTGIVDLTNGVEAPNSMLLPIEQYNLIASKRLGNGSDITVLKHFLEVNPFIQSVDWLVELKAANNDSYSNDAMVVYDRNPDKLTLEIPQEFETFPPFREHLDFVVDAHERIGGVIVYYPLSIALYEGI